jgi:hypothetical protein
MNLSSSVPVEIAKAAGLSLAFYVAMLSLLVALSASGFTLFVAVVAGFFLGIYLAVKGSVKLISDLVFDHVSQLFREIIGPVSQLYAQQQQRSGGAISQREFAFSMFKEAVIPLLLARIPALPMKDRLNRSLHGLVDNVEKALPRNAPGASSLAAVTGTSGLTQRIHGESSSFLNGFMQTAENEVSALKTRSEAAFQVARRNALIGWGVIWLMYFLL